MDRRKLLKLLGLSGLAAAVAPETLVAGEKPVRVESYGPKARQLAQKDEWNVALTNNLVPGEPDAGWQTWFPGLTEWRATLRCFTPKPEFEDCGDLVVLQIPIGDNWYVGEALLVAFHIGPYGEAEYEFVGHGPLEAVMD